MTFKEYWQKLSADEKTALADGLGNSRGYLAQIACGVKSGSPKLVKEIERITKGKVTREEMLPDVYGRVA